VLTVAKRKSKGGAAALRRTAIHEAGHAVLQTVLGIGCSGVTIVPSPGEGTAGHALHGGAWGKQGDKPGDPDDDVANLRLFAEDAFLLRHAIADYAGAEAVRRAAPRLKNWKAGAENDYREATFRLNEITEDPESVDLLFKYAQRRCELLVAHYWPEIQAVARALIKLRSLPPERSLRIIQSSLHARSAPHMGW
jgi:hypothetical protein